MSTRLMPALAALSFVAGCGGEPTLLAETAAPGQAPAEGSALPPADGSANPPPLVGDPEPLPAAPVAGEPAAGGAPGAPGSAPETPSLPVPAEPEPTLLPETESPAELPPEAEPPAPTTPDEPGTAPGEDEPGGEPDDDVRPGDGEPIEPPVDEDPAPDDVPPVEDPPDLDPPADEPPAGDDPPPIPGGSVGPGSAEIPGGLSAFHISVIGSSTANGIGASVGDFAWVTLLDDALSRRVATSYSTSNLAVGGYKAADLLPGSGAPGSIDEAIAEKPDLIVVALAGSNDIEPGFTSEMFMSQMASLRDAAQAAGIPAFFMSPLPKSLSVGEREILAEWSGLMAAEFGRCWIPGTSKSYAPCYIDVFDALAAPDLGLATQFDSGDGQHPNDLGHSLLFDAVDAIVQPYVCSKTECR